MLRDRDPFHITIVILCRPRHRTGHPLALGVPFLFLSSSSGAAGTASRGPSRSPLGLVIVEDDEVEAHPRRRLPPPSSQVATHILKATILK